MAIRRAPQREGVICSPPVDSRLIRAYTLQPLLTKHRYVKMKILLQLLISSLIFIVSVTPAVALKSDILHSCQAMLSGKNIVFADKENIVAVGDSMGGFFTANALARLYTDETGKVQPKDYKTKINAVVLVNPAINGLAKLSKNLLKLTFHYLFWPSLPMILLFYIN